MAKSKHVPHVHLVLPADGLAGKQMMGSFTLAVIAGLLKWLMQRGLISYEVMDEGALIFRQGIGAFYNPATSGQARPDLVMTSGPTSLAPRALEIVAACKGLDIPTLVGGVHFTCLPDEAVETGASLVHRGSLPSAKYLWRLIQLALKVGTGRKGLVTRCFDTPSPPDRPPADYSWLDPGVYGAPYSVQASEGCDHGCAFCAVPSGNIVTDHPLGRFRSNLDQMQPGCFVLLADDNAIRNLGRKLEDAQRFMDVAEVIHSHPFRFSGFATEVSVIALVNAQAVWADAGRGDYIAQLAERGMKILFLGIESLSRPGQKMLAKQAVLERSSGVSFEENVLHLSKLLKANGVISIGAFVLGCSGTEDLSYVMQVQEFLPNLTFAQVSVNTPTPGSYNFLRYYREGVISDFDWRKYDASNWLFRPKRLGDDPESPTCLDGEEVEGWHRMLYEGFYRHSGIPGRIASEITGTDLASLSKPNGWQHIIWRVVTSSVFYAGLAIKQPWENNRKEGRPIQPKPHPSVTRQIEAAGNKSYLYHADPLRDPYQYEEAGKLSMGQTVEEWLARLQ